jgi:Ku protein
MRSVALPPFMFIGATTVEGELDKPFRDRFQLQLQLQYYSVAELAQIITKAASNKGLTLVPPAAEDLARRSQGTPRVAKNLLTSCADYAAAMHDTMEITGEIVAQALELAGVDELGLDERSRAYLRCLCTDYRGGPVGIVALAATSGIDARTISSAVEPFLLRSGLLRLTSAGRVATAAGFRHLGLSVPPQIKALEGEVEDSDGLPEIEVYAVEQPREFGLSDWLAETPDELAEQDTAPSVLDRIPTWNQDADEDLFPEPATPVVPAPAWDVPISELISDLDAEVGSHEAASVVTDPEPVVAAQRAVQPVVSEPVAPRCLWVGTINAGMMSTPVRLYAAHTDRHGVELHQSHNECRSRLSQKMICQECGRVVDASEIGRTDGEHHITHAAYAELAAEAIRAIDITDFVPAADIDLTVLAEATYTVGADKNGSKALGLMHAALRAEGRIGIGRVVLRSVERLVAVHVVDGQLRVSLLRWHDQIKQVVEVPTVDVSDAELDQARALIASMASKFSHEAYADPREEKLAELLAG